MVHPLCNYARVIVVGVFFSLYEYLLHQVLVINIENVEMLFIRMSINFFFLMHLFILYTYECGYMCASVHTWSMCRDERTT